MGLSAPDIYNPIDIQKTTLGGENKVDKPYIEKTKEGKSNFELAMGKIKSELAENGKTLELPKSIEEQEKDVYDFVWNVKLKKSRENGDYTGNIEVKYIDKGVFAVQSKKTKNISFFVNERGEDLLVLSDKKESFIEKDTGKFFPTTIKAMKEAGYYVDFKNGKRDIYKILGENRDGTFILDDFPLDIFSKDYYQAWKKLVKIDDTLLILFSLKHGGENNENSIDSYVKSGALTLRLLSLLNNKGLLGNGELFKYAINKMGIKESDVKKAFEKGEITKEQALNIYKVLSDKSKDLSN